MNNTAKDNAVISTADLEDAIAEGSKVGLFLRHAERYQILPDTPDWGNDVLLTPKGVTDAERFGHKLRSFNKIHFWSSPIERCRQTAAAIASGAGHEGATIHSHHFLGCPGIYIDGSGAHTKPMKRDFFDFAEPYIYQGVAPGMKPFNETSKKLLSFLQQGLNDSHCTVYISHDFFVAAMMRYLGLKSPNRNSWCEFLEGVCIINRGSGHIYHRLLGMQGAGIC